MGCVARRRVPRGWPGKSGREEGGRHDGRTQRWAPRRWAPRRSMGGGERRRVPQRWAPRRWAPRLSMGGGERRPVPRGWPGKSGHEEDGHHDGRTQRWAPRRWAPRRSMGGGVRRRVPRVRPGKRGREEDGHHDGRTQRWAPSRSMCGGARRRASRGHAVRGAYKRRSDAAAGRGSAPGVRVLRTLMGAASSGVPSARPLPQPQKWKTGQLMAVWETALGVPGTQEAWQGPFEVQCGGTIQQCDALLSLTGCHGAVTQTTTNQSLWVPARSWPAHGLRPPTGSATPRC